MRYISLIFIGIFFFCNSAYSKTTALLVGVSDYDETIGLADLRGPTNDVRLMRDVLRMRGVEDIRILADNLEGAERPTRMAIMRSLQELQETANKGDFFIIHMSGHGTRQPDQNGDEGDGYDEVFLPADVTRAEPGTLTIPNGIVDEEIGQAVDGIRARGADVWFIMDACHSGTGLRAGSLSTADRFIDPKILGLPDIKPGNAAATSDTIIVDGDERSDLDGKLIAFYSAQSDELAREVDFSASQTNESETMNGWYGLFTAKLANRLLFTGAISYRQLFQNVMADMSAANVPGAARLQTPFWEGTLIDGAVLGGSETIGVRQYALDDDELKAGSVHGLAVGTILELVADAGAGKDDALGYAQIEEVNSLSSFIRPISDACAPDANVLCQSVGTISQDAKFARISIVPFDETIKLSPILSRNDASKSGTFAVLDDSHPISIQLKAAVNSANDTSGTRFEFDKDNYDIEVSLIKGTLWFGHKTVAKDEPLGVAWEFDSQTENTLQSILSRIAYAERFAATLGAIADNGSLLNLSPVRVTAKLRSSDASKLIKPGQVVDPVKECRKIIRQNAFQQEADLLPSTDIKQCDIISVVAQGEIQGARDINRIHIDSNFCVHAEYARVEDTRRPVPIGNDMIMCSDCPSSYAAGDERMFVIVSEARTNIDQLNLEGVVDNCGPTHSTRGARSNSLSNFLKSVAKPPGTRGAMGGFATEKVWVEKMNWRVLPRAIALKGTDEISAQ